MALQAVVFQSSVLATPQSGTRVAADILPTTLEAVQYVKLMDGREDQSAYIGGDANGLFVQGGPAATPLPVSGTFWPVTQPISGTVGISGSVQIGAPLGSLAKSLSVAVAIASDQIVPVTGTLTGITNPVKIQDSSGNTLNSTVNALNVSLMRADGSAISYNQGGSDAGTQRVVLAGAGNLSDAIAGSSVPLLGVELMAYDGTNWGRVRASVAGTSIAAASPGILGVQGVTGGIPLPISGSITATFPTQDLDTSAGIDNQPTMGLMFASSVGKVVVSAADPLPVAGSFTVGGVADNAPFVFGTTPLSPTGYVVDDTASAPTGTENSVVAARVDLKRAQVLVLEDATTRGQRATVALEGVATPTDPAGLPLMARYRPTSSTETGISVSGQAIALNASDAGELFIRDSVARASLAAIDATTAAINTVVGKATRPDGIAWSYTTPVDYENPIALLVDDTPPTALGNGIVGLPRMSPNRSQYIQIRDGAAGERGAGVTTRFALQVEGVAGGVAQPVSLAANQTVDLARIAGTVASVNAGNLDAGTLRVTLATNQTALTTPLPVAGAGVAGATPTTNILAVQGTPTGTPLPVTTTPGTTGGWTSYSNVALTNTKVSIVAVACNVGGYIIHNPGAATAFIQVFDILTASVTLGTTPPTWVIGIPAGATANVEFGNGIKHTAAFVIAATSTAGGNGAPTTALAVSFFYK